MRIALLVEGKTERAFLPFLREFLRPRLPERMPRIRPIPYDGRIPREDRLRRIVGNLLSGKAPYDAVIALTDVYTGTSDFADAADAKRKMRQWVGDDPKFHPHAPQYDFEAWLLPFWDVIQQLAGHNKSAPAGRPEQVNHTKPASRYLIEIFRLGTCRDDYVKPRDAPRILKSQDLLQAAAVCPELKAFLNTILTLCGASPIPEGAPDSEL